MTAALATDWFRQMLWTAIVISAPAIVTALVVGLFLAIFQAATQLNDSVVSFAPKALAAVASMAICGPWILSRLSEFTIKVIRLMGHLYS